MSFDCLRTGEITESWSVCELRSFLSLITYGFTNPMPDACDGPWKLTAKDIVGGRINYATARRTTHEAFTNLLTDKSRPKVGDVLLTKDGSIGRVAVVDRPDICINQSVALLRPNGKVNPHYLKYLLMSPYYQQVMEGDSDGSTIKHIYITRVDKMQVAIPPYEEQLRILGVLTSLDERIALLRETIITLEAIVQALFKSWFVDFDPVRAKMEGRIPEGMDETTAALFPVDLEGAMPRGWRLDSVYAAAQLIYGAPFASKQFNSAGVGKPLVRIRDLRDESPGVFTPEVHPKGYLIQPGDIVVGMDGEFRSYLWGGEEAWLNQRVCIFAPKPGFPAAFVHRSIVPLLAAVEESETATTVIHLGKNDIDRFMILVPDERVLGAFGSVTDTLYQRIVKAKQCARTLSILRDTLLPRLISGQLRIPEAEAQIDALAA